jgi:DnaK suppressor protein
MDVQHYRRRLLLLEKELVARRERELDTARDTRDDQPSLDDAALVDELRDDYLTLATTDAEILAQVRAALQRIDTGTYGWCLMCNQPIGDQRLDAVPWTPLCRTHQEQLEARQGVRTPSL